MDLTNSTDFPEELFPAVNQDVVNLGKEISSNKRILFCGICRDVGNTIHKNIKRIKRTAEKFKDHKVYIYENDSSDNTTEILKEFKNKSLIECTTDNREDKNYKDIISQGLDVKHLNRCNVLASCRNNYIDYLKNNCNDYDYMCVIDFDIHGWSYSGFYHSIACIENAKDISSMSSYGVLGDVKNTRYIENCKQFLFYDSFAFRPLGLNVPMTRGLQVQFNLLTPLNSNLTEVESNFGGMCIYKTDTIKDAKYSAKEHDKFVDCDHVCFNREIKNNGYKHYFNPNMVVSYSKHRFSNA